MRLRQSTERTMFENLDALSTAEYKLSGIKIERIDGQRVWTFDGLKHRDDGPAVEGQFQHLEYWIHGTRMSEKDFYEREKD